MGDEVADVREKWVSEAYLVLLEVARKYRAVITYKELGEEIQERSGVRTQALLHNWIGAVLGKVVREAHRRGDPPLTALVVHTDDGMVGNGYKEVLELAGLPPVENVLDREHHAADARLECYRKFSLDLPKDGGSPALSPKHQTAVDRQRARVAEPAAICRSCCLQLPSTGICDSCG